MTDAAPSGNVNEEARRRSVGNLQRVYTVVVSLAITEALRRLLSPAATNPITEIDIRSLIAVVSLLVTIIPFYHGANRYLDATYVTGERTAKSSALMLDFIVIFLEGLIFFVLALLIANTTAFFTGLALLFFLDSAWVALTRVTSESPLDRGREYATWSISNIAAGVIILLFIWSNLLSWEIWPTLEIAAVAVGVVALLRTIIDYATVWNFYYPPTPEAHYIMPVPRPATPPRRTRS